MDDEVELSPGDRVVRLLDHLGIGRAHFGQGVAEAEAHPDVVASIAMIMPAGSVAQRVQAIVERGSLAVPPLVVHGDSGPLADGAPKVLAAVPGSTAVSLHDYHTALWSDLVADRADEVVPALLAYFGQADRREPLPSVGISDGAEGEVAGISYLARGSGPPLLLFPLELTASQWEPVVPALAEQFC